MGTMRVWVKGHQLIAFFVVALLLMFVLLPLALYVIPTTSMLGQVAKMFIGRLAVFSPVLAGIIVYRISETRPRERKRTSRWLAFVISWVPTTLIAFLNAKYVNHVPVAWHLIMMVAALAALIPAYVISCAFSGIRALRDFLSTFLKPRGNVVWYLVAIFTFPVVHLLGVLLTSLVKGTPVFSGASFSGDLLTSFGVSFIYVLFFAGGLNEESGWRGFAVKHMQARFSPLIACLILWLVMVAWHIPNDLIQYRSGNYLQVRILLYPFITVLFTWVYNRTRGSILAPALFHASMNSMNPLMGILPLTTVGDILLIAFAIFAVVYDKMWRTLPPEHPAVKQQDTEETPISVAQT